jgi:riboflavin biosynthesis pyrimidine reductase
MVMSMDGAYARDGTSGALSSDADHELFIAHRNTADAILVGAATVRQENYSRPTVSAKAAEIRRRRGQSALPMLVITSSSLDLGTNTPLLRGNPPAPIIAHPARSDTSVAPEGFELIELGDTSVDLALLLSELAERGVRRVACEGGPGLLGQLAEADLIDEFLVTISPQLVGGAMVGLLGRARAAGLPFELHEVLCEENHLMCSYRRDRFEAT